MRARSESANSMIPRLVLSFCGTPVSISRIYIYIAQSGAEPRVNRAVGGHLGKAAKHRRDSMRRNDVKKGRTARRAAAQSLHTLARRGRVSLYHFFPPFCRPAEKPA